MYEVTMPRLSDSMEVGRIVQWKVQEGDRVRPGDVLAEIESDKAVMELECFAEGVVSRIVRGADAEVRIGEVIAYIAQEGDQTPAPAQEGPPASSAAKAPQAVAATPEGRRPEPARPALRPAAPPPAPAQRVAISPYARKLAEKQGVDYAKLQGSGPGGRILARDVTGARKSIAPAPDEELPPVEVGEDEADVEEASFRHRTQALRVTAAKHAIPHFYVTCGAEVSGLLEKKDALKQQIGATLTHLVMLASLKAIGDEPQVNRSYDRGRIIKWKGVHLGLAVDTEQGLTVAVLRHAEALSLPEIVARTAELVDRARAGKLSAEERRHPTFVITNLGMFGVEDFCAIINPPAAVTLAVAAALPAPVVRDGAVKAGTVMKLTLSCDHRVIDGVTAARFLKRLQGWLEAPERLLEGQAGAAT